MREQRSIFVLLSVVAAVVVVLVASSAAVVVGASEDHGTLNSTSSTNSSSKISSSPSDRDPRPGGLPLLHLVNQTTTMSPSGSSAAPLDNNASSLINTNNRKAEALPSSKPSAAASSSSNNNAKPSPVVYPKYSISDQGIYTSGPPVNETGNTVLTVGYLTAIKGDLKDRQGIAISGAITIALDEINNNPDILPNVTLAMRWNDTRGDTVLATKAITEMICDGVTALLGPEGNCYVEGIVSQSRNIPMISYKCSNYLATPIPTFARTEPPDSQVTKSVISLLNYYGWKKFSIIYDKAWTVVANSLRNQALKLNMTINHLNEVQDNHQCCESDLECCRTGYWYSKLRETMYETRIYVFLGPIYTLSHMMEAMDSLKLFQDGEYMVIFVDMETYSVQSAARYIFTPEQQTRQNCGGLDFIQRARSLLVVVSSPPVANYENFTLRVREYNKREPFKFSTPDIFRLYAKYVSIYAAYLYDSVILYANALDTLLKEEMKAKNATLTEEEIRNVAANGTKIVETIILNKTYQSVTGATIKIDEFGDSEGNFSVLALKEVPFLEKNFSCNYQMVPVALFIQGANFPEYKIINASVKIDWPGEDRPFDMPSCGFKNELCRGDSQVMSMIVAGILGLILFCATVIVMSIYRKWKIELEIEGLLWKIEPEEIFGYFGNDIVASPSKLSLASAASYGSKYSTQVFTSTAKYRGVMVRIKELKFSKKKDISREVMKEMRNLRELRHDNINSFIGACVEPMRILLVTDYCTKGSLYDIVENEDIKLEDIFIASLVHDLIKAMLYIHNSYLGYHGNLKSSNCVVTSRWVLQVTDFGLHDLRQCAENESIGEHQHFRNLFWRAPELLRSPNVYGSRAGDVYAFSIILYEIIGRKGPFGLTGAEPKEIIDLVRHVPDISEFPFRPDVECLSDTGNCPDYVLSCIQDCWHENPDMRPDFPTIRNRLKKMRGGKSKNIMDQMMEMMEKYTNNLEEIVNDRTRLLCEEKRKTEDLLHRMLPQSVAEKLTSGHGVEPVSYDNVTIYFSDIVGFTAMSAESTPLQVVNFLNDLYTVFDRIIKGYDVYKVETIGDAYMVVSGLPIKNGDLHVGEVASMALDLLEAVKSHKISHRPNETLKLRIGMHTGPVVAGVVGLTMPRFCLFGDTVNTASRMESNGEALKIHISPDCKTALDKLGGYITEIRGAIHMKGKGEVVTHWLVGATEAAIQRTPVSLDDLPPPLFCRPRKSPKTESRQPSLIAGSCFGIPNLTSRRTSAVPKNDIESSYSLQGSINPPNGSPRALHRLPSKLDRFPLYLNHGSRTTLVENPDHNHQQHADQMEMGALVRKKHSVSMDGDGEEAQNENEDEQTHQLLINEQANNGGHAPKKINVMIKPCIGASPPAGDANYNQFKTFNEKRTCFDPSNLLLLRESRSLDRFPSSDQRNKRLSFKKLASKLTFSNSNNKKQNELPSGPATTMTTIKPGMSSGGGPQSNGSLYNNNATNYPVVPGQQQQQPQTSDYFTAPKSSDSGSFIDNSILKLAGDGLLLPPTSLVKRTRSQATGTTATGPLRSGNGSGDHTVINCNGYDGAGSNDEEPLVETAPMPRRPAIKTGSQRRNDSLCLSRNSETEGEEDGFDKKWRSMDTLKDKRFIGGGSGNSSAAAGGKSGNEKRYERDYYFDGSGHDSASDDNRSNTGEENQRRINFVDDFTSADESSDATTTNRDADSVSPRGKWYKNIFNNGNGTGTGNATSGIVEAPAPNHNSRGAVAAAGQVATHKPDNLLLNNNNNNNNSNRNKNHKRFNLSSKVNALESIKQSPESKEEGEESLFLEAGANEVQRFKPPNADSDAVGGKAAEENYNRKDIPQDMPIAVQVEPAVDTSTTTPTNVTIPATEMIAEKFKRNAPPSFVSPSGLGGEHVA